MIVDFSGASGQIVLSVISRRIMNTNNLHVVPTNDLREHESSVSCWCSPTPDESEPNVYIHHSMDGREAFEEGERKLN